MRQEVSAEAERLRADANFADDEHADHSTA
jgi:hypothetical protein